ncbi:MAG TPA: aminoglycoside phosphotransferase family protein [Streptosporangiaceae bacterium]|nr:aminoglycoside phosphotransferase family protein [Streptosporangiaceae bacterium]
MTPRASFTTHVVDIEGDQVIKRFRSWDRGEHLREWQALTLLARYAPGLAPVPLSAGLTSVPPCVRMSRVAGRPLDGQTVTPRHLDAVAAAISRLHAAVPRDVVAGLPPQPWLGVGAVSQMRSIAARARAVDGEDPARVAFDAGMHWLGRAADPQPGPRSVVFGQGDGNLANYLWDGGRVRLVDFEDSGRSDRAYELAAFAEHLSVWHDAGVDAGALLGRFELTGAERERVLFFRRAFAFYWLLKLVGRGAERHAALHRQAARLLALLGD